MPTKEGLNGKEWLVKNKAGKNKPMVEKTQLQTRRTSEKEMT